MNVEYLPVPRQLQCGDGRFRLSNKSNVFVNKAKIQDFVMDLFGFLWKNFKLQLKISPIRDKDYKDDYEQCFFIYISNENHFPEHFETFFKNIEGKSGEEYYLEITETHVVIISKTTRGVFNGILTVQQMRDSMKVSVDGQSKDIIVHLNAVTIRDTPHLEVRAVHLDLKFQLHAHEYLKEHVRMLAKFKINAIVWEWEDKFPFKKHPEIKHPIAFDAAETSELMELCNMYGIESIPLVQTFGHLEFVLKHDRYKHLKETREVDGYQRNTLDICPLQEGTIPLLEDMIGDVVSYHPRSRYFHVGGDEVYSIGTCPDCKKFVKEKGAGDVNRGKSMLYIQHVNRVASVVKGYGKIPMIWHDYLLKYPEFIDELDKDFVIVYWKYGRDNHPDDFKREIEFFKQRGFKVLAASSVRSDFQYAVPNYSTRFQNIHELHGALLATPDNVAGVLATSWAVCRAPIETTVPGLLFFANASWAVNQLPYSDEVLLDATRRISRLFFEIPDESLNKHDDVLLLLQQATVPPNQANDLKSLDEKLGAALVAWKGLQSNAKAGMSVVINILHGLELQQLRVKLFILVGDIVQGFEQDDLPGRNDIKNFLNRAETLIKEFQLIKYKTKELYEKYMYDTEVVEELELRFEKPLKTLEEVKVVMGNLESTMWRAYEALKKVQTEGDVFNEEEMGKDLFCLASKISKGFAGMVLGDRIPLDIGTLEDFTMKAMRIMKGLDEKMKKIMETIVVPIKVVHETIDEFMFRISVKSLQPGDLNQF